MRDCALVAMATGVSVLSLREFRESVRTINPSSIYHHFWGRLLQPQFDEPEYNNDFASWVHRALHDKALAERLSAIDPTEFDSLEDLRLEILETVEERLDESEVFHWARADQQFHFIHSQIVVLNTGRTLQEPHELTPLLPTMSHGCIFYHFIDARRRTDVRRDDFSMWLEGYGEKYTELAEKIRNIDPYFSSLKEIRRLLWEVFAEHFSGGLH
ncbi:MAG: DUF5752 family protein [Planctomycetota bacterium]